MSISAEELKTEVSQMSELERATIGDPCPSCKWKNQCTMAAAASCEAHKKYVRYDSPAKRIEFQHEWDDNQFEAEQQAKAKLHRDKARPRQSDGYNRSARSSDSWDKPLTYNDNDEFL